MSRAVVDHVRRSAPALALLAAAPAAARAQAGAGPAAAPAPRYHAAADARHAGPEGARVGGVPTFRTVGAAVASLPPNGAERQVVFVRNGRYREKLTLELPRLTLVGETRDSAVLTYDAYAGQATPTGGTWGTRNSATLRVVAPDFRAEHLTVENAFDYLANLRKPAGDPTKVVGAQGVALALDSGSDRAAFEDVRLVGHQDTLYPNAGRAWFHRSRVEGSVDFIFGAGVAVFEACDIVSRDRSSSNNGYITAASTPAAQPIGFLFVRSRLVKESPAVRANSVALGRPWKPFADPTLQPNVVFVDTWMDDHVGARGWDRMGMTDSTGQRMWSEPGDARFFEVRSTGPGAVSGPNRRILSGAEAARYTVRAALGDWLPRASPHAGARAASATR